MAVQTGYALTGANGDPPQTTTVSRTLISPYGTSRESPIIQLADKALAIYGYGLTESVTVAVYSVGPDGAEIPFNYNGSALTLTADNNPIVLAVSGRYKLVASGTTPVTVLSYPWNPDGATESKNVKQPYAAQVQRPNLLLSPTSGSLISKTLVVQDIPMVVQAYGLVDDDYILTTSNCPDAGVDSDVPFKYNGKDYTLTVDNNTIVLDVTGRYKFYKLAEGMVTLVAMPQGAAWVDPLKTQGVPGPPGATGAAGVVQSVVAGTNVTVDSTDPANPVVSATGDVTAAWGDITGTLSDQTDLQAALDGKEDAFSTGKLVAGANVTLTGSLDNRLVGAGDVTIAASGSEGTDWGDIGGTLADQTDLQSALDGKEDAFTKGSLIQGANVTLTGTLANRLVGTGDVTIAASGGGSGGIESVVAGEGIGVDDADPANPVVSNTGVLSVVAGTNVTVDSTDPANPVVSATGGGGGGSPGGSDREIQINDSGAFGGGGALLYPHALSPTINVLAIEGAIGLIQSNSTGEGDGAVYVAQGDIFGYSNSLAVSYSGAVLKATDATISSYAQATLSGAQISAAYGSDSSYVNSAPTGVTIASSDGANTTSIVVTPSGVTGIPAGDLIQGTGVTLTGTLTDRLLGTGDITIAASGGGGGGIESIVAGDGIAVDDTDPANPIVSATGAAYAAYFIPQSITGSTSSSAFAGKLIKLTPLQDMYMLAIVAYLVTPSSGENYRGIVTTVSGGVIATIEGTGSLVATVGASSQFIKSALSSPPLLTAGIAYFVGVYRTDGGNTPAVPITTGIAPTVTAWSAVATIDGVGTFATDTPIVGTSVTASSANYGVYGFVGLPV